MSANACSVNAVIDLFHRTNDRQLSVRGLPWASAPGTPTVWPRRMAKAGCRPSLPARATRAAESWDLPGSTIMSSIWRAARPDGTAGRSRKSRPDTQIDNFRPVKAIFFATSPHAVWPQGAVPW